MLRNIWKKQLLILLYVSIGSFTLYAQTQNPWIFKKETKGIKIYYRESPESQIYELKLTTSMEGSLSAAVAVINDAPRFPEWVFRCKEGKILKQISDIDFIYYNLTNFPWPMDDREFVVYATTEQDPTTLTVYMKSSGVEPSTDILPLNEDYIRVEEVISNWTFTPQKGGKMLAEYYLKSDPGGYIPARLINWGLDVGPVKSLVKLKEMIQSDEYRDMKFDYIRELE